MFNSMIYIILWYDFDFVLAVVIFIKMDVIRKERFKFL